MSVLKEIAEVRGAEQGGGQRSVAVSIAAVSGERGAGERFVGGVAAPACMQGICSGAAYGSRAVAV
jgi:hypothetical protein